MGDDVVIAAGVGVGVKDLIATALLATLVLVHAVHKSRKKFGKKSFFYKNKFHYRSGYSPQQTSSLSLPPGVNLRMH